MRWRRWISRLFVGHWPIVLVPFILVNAVLAEDPYRAETRAMWLGTAVVMFIAGMRQTRDWNLTAMCVGMFSAVARSYVLVTDSALSEAGAWRAAFVWFMVAVLIVTVTIAVEMARVKQDAPRRAVERAERAGQTVAARG